jgi:hypothetical protein
MMVERIFGDGDGVESVANVKYQTASDWKEEPKSTRDSQWYIGIHSSNYARQSEGKGKM